MAKSKKPKEHKLKCKSLFEHSDHVFTVQDPNYFDTLTEGDKKTWTNYMINRLLSMQPNYVEVVNLLQKYSPMLKPELYYKLLIGAFPKTRKQWNPYLKGKQTNKFDESTIKLFCKYFECGSCDAIEYLTILSSDLDGQQKIKEICEKFGLEK